MIIVKVEKVMEKVMIGVDIGGTAVKIGFITESGDFITKWEIPTNTANNGLSIVDDDWTSIEDKVVQINILKGNIIRMVVGAPGFIDGESGLVYVAVNIDWKDMPLSEKLNEVSELH